ncbi:hypothetical protein SLEP1_g42928 [Rubroshorea leprosula]|uniref:Uncharacterized protein n=1 Tax=Rubroshorea leprosula TaxID=152421 RepID=A0AAV5LBE8_9ROSI|nr:hypothetical protein SLEP1_g42928 [Rubroshorea leprosula]
MAASMSMLHPYDMADDVANLEWVSQFVDDSLPESPPLCSSSKQKTDSHAKSVSVKSSCFVL